MRQLFDQPRRLFTGQPDPMPATTDAESRYSLQTPLLKRLPLLYYKYYKEGYQPGRAGTTVSPGKTTTLDVELERE
jgi:hypothetical protein